MENGTAFVLKKFSVSFGTPCLILVETVGAGRDIAVLTKTEVLAVIDEEAETIVEVETITKDPILSGDVIVGLTQITIAETMTDGGIGLPIPTTIVAMKIIIDEETLLIKHLVEIRLINHYEKTHLTRCLGEISLLAHHAEVLLKQLREKALEIYHHKKVPEIRHLECHLHQMDLRIHPHEIGLEIHLGKRDPEIHLH